MSKFALAAIVSFAFAQAGFATTEPKKEEVKTETTETEKKVEETTTEKK